MYARRLVISLALLATLFVPAADAQTSAERYRAVPATTDGVGKSHMGRQIARVMGWQAASWLEREEREREERSDLLPRILDLREGMVVADVGAGTGYYARRFADQVGAKGKVYAVDVQPQMLKLLAETAKQSGFRNIEPVLGTATDTKLPKDSVDLAVMVDVYHELEFPFETLASIVGSLKPDGRVVFVEYRAEDRNVPIKALHKMSEPQIRREAEQHALVYERTVNAMPWQHVVIFRRR